MPCTRKKKYKEDRFCYHKRIVKAVFLFYVLTEKEKKCYNKLVVTDLLERSVENEI